MSRTNLPIDERVREIIASQLCLPNEDEVTPGSNIKEDLGADSLDSVEIIMLLEENFDIQITDDEAEKVVTVADAVKLVEGKVKK